VSQNIVPWNSLLLRTTRDHACKQLLAIVIDHIHPDTDEFLRRMDKWKADHTESMSLLNSLEHVTDENERRKILARLDELKTIRELLPAAVADTLNMLRHEKVGRWQSKAWVWDEDPDYDHHAKAIAEGSLDREKQDGLYVKLGRDGTLVSTPTSVRREVASEALERAKRFERLLRQLLNDDTGGLLDYDRIKEVFTLLFESPKSEKADASSV
jgi:hypothetical protein